MILALILSQIAFASPTAPKRFAVDMEVSRGGNTVVSRQNMALLEDEDGEVTENKTFVDVVARQEEAGNKVQLDLEVGTIDANGKKKVEARPRVVALENQTSTITQEAEGTHAPISVSITARQEK